MKKNSRDTAQRRALDRAKKPLFVARYNGSAVELRGFEIPVMLPDRPADRDFVNYGKPILQQKFFRDQVPTDKEWAVMDDVAKDAFAEKMWHKRIHGDWWLIKGTEVYITGPCWFFLNFWWMKEEGCLPEFRMGVVDWFLITNHIERDSNAFGQFNIKGRRDGITENSLCYGYELITRYRNSRFGMQNVNDDYAKKNFDRLTYGHLRMAPWFKPKHRGNDDPQGGLYFDVPHTDDGPKSLYSEAIYGPTKVKVFDGTKLRFYHMDEPGKISPKVMPVVQQWGVAKECLAVKGSMRIRGKAALTSTVEEIADGSTVAECKKLWKISDPRQKDSTGRTVSGLYRYFRNFRYCAEVDEWGFHKDKELAEFRSATIRSLIAAGDLKDLSAFKRKYPDTIEEALSVPEMMCVLYPELIDRQLATIEYMKEERRNTPWNEEAKEFPHTVYGDLVWESEFGGRVKWIPSPDGHFCISQHPTMPNARSYDNGPGNTGTYSMGSDPVDHKMAKGRSGSDPAFAIFRNLDMLAESGLEHRMGEDGQMVIANKTKMKTNRFVCTYRWRSDNPERFYEDSLKAAIYYGAKNFVERQKPGLSLYYERLGFLAYLAWKPKSAVSSSAQSESTPGMHQSATSLQAWQDIYKMHKFSFWETYVHEEQLHDERSFTGDNQGDCDLVVASGMALYYAKHIEHKLSKKQDTWESLPFRTYQTSNN